MKSNRTVTLQQETWDIIIAKLFISGDELAKQAAGLIHMQTKDKIEEEKHETK